VSATGLTPGNTYYIMIDGFAGDVCDYTFAANSGVAIPVDVNPVTSSVCAGQSVTLTATGGNGTYNWNASPNLSGTTGATVTATPPSTPGTYTYTVNSSGGNPMCPSSTSATATITVTPCGGCTITASNSGNVCEGTPTFNLTATNVAGATFNWVGPNGFTSTAQNPTAVPVPATPGSYTYTVTATVAGVPCSSTTTLVVNPTPTITAPVTTLCAGATTTLTGSGTAHATTPWASSNTSVATVSASSVVTAVATGTTTITFMNSGSCTQTQVMTVVANPTATISGSTTICSGSNATITFAGTPNATVTYQVGGANQTIVLDAAGNATISVSPASTTTYSLSSVQINPPGGCSATISGSATITVSPLPVATAVLPINECTGANVSVPAFVSTPAGATFNWSNSNPSIGLAANGTGNIPSFTGLNPGTTPNSATITLIPTLNNCVGTAITFVITITPPPTANAGTAISLCQGVSTGNQLGLPPVAGNSYSWSPATGLSDATIANPTFSTSVPGTTTYTLTVTNAAGCTSSDAVIATVFALPVVSFSSNITAGCNPQTIIFTNNSANSVNCVWNFQGFGTQNGCGTVTQWYNAAGVFDVGLTITDANGCTNSASNVGMISIFPQPDAHFSANPTQTSIVDPYFVFTNTSSSALNYSWNFGDGTTSSAFSPSHTYPETPGSYRVILYASSGPCIDSAWATVEIADELIYYVPNTFTPDGDEHNNVFLPVFNNSFDKQSYTMLIFNRWGEVLFESHDLAVGWDGTYFGEMCKEGQYAYKIVIKQRNRDKRIEVIGHVNLFR
ncbi:PKD domain-containing protein, partial [Fluviicola sp.]|uniref:PKD domain-containing protein n=1 Tax=Fluviicola sp. TaxID=1917219 RepID=UPI0026199C6B